MKHERTRDITIMNVSYSAADRYLKPSRDAIREMKLSLQLTGQISPIGVYPITTHKFRLIYGATRFVAAMELGWKTILASVFSGHPDDFRIYELSENVERRDLSTEQRQAMKKEILELQSKRLAEVEPAVGGRGHKGGLREAARRAGISEPTARRRKLRQNDSSDAVSDPQWRQRGRRTLSTWLSTAEFERMMVICKQNNWTLAHAVRIMILDYINRGTPETKDEATTWRAIL
jgi:hypothetical protein